MKTKVVGASMNKSTGKFVCVCKTGNRRVELKFDSEERLVSYIDRLRKSSK